MSCGLPTRVLPDCLTVVAPAFGAHILRHLQQAQHGSSTVARLIPPRRTPENARSVLGVLEWPIALVRAGGHALAADQHHRAVQQFGDALEDV